MGPTSTIVEVYEYKQESITGNRTIIRNPGLRGSRTRVIERLRQGTQAPGGTLVFEPTLAELRNLIPRILGGAEVSETGFYQYATADTLIPFWLSIDKQAKVFNYQNMYVDEAEFHSGPGSPLTLTLHCESLTQSLGAAGSFQSGLTISAAAPMVHFDSTLTLAGNAVQAMDITLSVKNMLKKDRFVNSQTRTDLPPMGRVVTLKVTLPYTSDTTAFYDTGPTGVTADVYWSVGGVGDGAAGTDIHFILGTVVFPAPDSPTVQGEDEVPLSLTGEVYSLAGAAEISAKIDITA
jgi:hypothetical protein